MSGANGIDNCEKSSVEYCRVGGQLAQYITCFALAYLDVLIRIHIHVNIVASVYRGVSLSLKRIADPFAELINPAASNPVQEIESYVYTGLI